MGSPIKRRARLTVIRHALWHADRHCHWCERETVLGWNSHVSDDLATVDHIVSRYVATSEAQYHAPANQVLACFRCNQQRAQEEHDARVPRRAVVIDWENPMRNLTTAFTHHACNPRAHALLPA